jgi:16S rRNA (uracil1498-N3)-methyltransferase
VTRSWFYAPELDPERGEVVLPPDEAHHLTRVMRLDRGDEVSVFDGRGRECRARVERIQKGTVSLTILETLPAPPEAEVPIALAQAILKADKMDAVVRDATMAGVARITPLVTERTLVSLASLARGHTLERWRRVAVASAKQSRRARLPHFDLPSPLTDWLRAPLEGLRLMLVEPAPDGRDLRSLRAALAGSRPVAVTCIVGPEGGWSAGERETAVSAGCVPVSLGPMTLRADAAGLIAVSLVSYALSDG